MDKLSQNEIGSIYGQLMNEVKLRLRVLGDIGDAEFDDGDFSGAIISAELGYLQVRKICEASALATLCAHNLIERTNTNKFYNEYNAEAIFGMLSKVNADGFPAAITHQAGDALFLPSVGPMNRTELKAAYRRANEVLHSGWLSHRIIGKKIKIDFNELRRFRARFMELLAYHAIQLPEINAMLVCRLDDERANGNVGVYVGRMEKAEPLSDGQSGPKV